MSVRNGLAAISLLLSAIAAAAPAAAARQVDLSFEIFSGGFHVLSLTSRSTLDDGSYVIEARLKTEGLAHALANFDSRQQASGLLDDLGARPIRYESRSTSRFGDRTVVMVFGPDGRIDAETQPPPDEDDRAPVPQRYRRGALDPLSALLIQVTDMDPAAPCTGTTAIFDGRRLYNLHFHYVGHEELSSNRYGAYTGPVVKCRVVFERLKGFGEGEELRRKQREPIFVWLAQPENAGLTIPVRLVTDTDWGPVIAHLTDYRIEEPSAPTKAVRSPKP